jgi:hypothetical protein
MNESNKTKTAYNLKKTNTNKKKVLLLIGTVAAAEHGICT